MKKVILFIPTLSIAGAEKFVVDLAVNINKQKYDVIVGITYCLKHTDFVKILKDNNIKIVVFDDNNIIKKTIKIHKFLKKYKPDIIHANVGSLLHILASMHFCSAKVRIFTFHSMAERTAGTSKIKKALYSYAFNQLKFVPIGICEQVTNSISKVYNYKKDIPCVYNGVDTDKFYPIVKINNTTCNGSIKLISTGRLYEVKNHKLLIEAFSIVEKKYPHILLDIIGEGELKKEIEDLIKEKNLENKITLLGNKNNVEDYLQRSDIYVMSSNVEGLPLSVLEAMACGLPIVTTKAGGVVDIVKEGESGFICPVGDTMALALCLEKLIRNEKLRNQMVLASRKKAEELDIKKCVRKYEEIYEKVYTENI